MAWPTKTDFVDGDVLTAAQVNNIGTNLNLANPTGITDGFVLTANGAGSMGWEAVASGGMTLLATANLSGQTTVTVSSISQDYINLFLIFRGISTSTSGSRLYVYPNGSAQAANLYSVQMDNATTFANNNTVWGMPQMGNPATDRSIATMIIYNYKDTVNWKTAQWQAATDFYATSNNFFAIGQFRVASAITSIEFNRSAGNMVGTVLIYGVK